MNALVDHLWEKARPLLFITREQFDRTLEGWDVQLHVVDGEKAFISVTKGAEFHFDSLGTDRPMTLRMIKDFLRPIIAEHGHAITRTPHEDDRQHRFNRLIGFAEVGRDEHDVIYRIERIRGCQL